MLNLHPNDTFANRFRLQRRLGIGGFSEVWLVWNEVAGLSQVLKIYTGLDGRGRDIFRKEFTRVYNLQHSNLMRSTTFDVYKDMPYLVMPYCKQGSLAKYVRKVNEQDIARILYDIGNALAYIHQPKYSIIHRDIKPDNILIADDGTYLLSDFGISGKLKRKLQDYASRNSKESQSEVGVTPMGYRSPEYFDRDNFEGKPVIKTDIWALGATLYELATGKLPFGELGGTVQLLKNAKPEKLPAPFSSGLNRILQQCLAKRPWDRPTANDLYLLGKSYLQTGSWEEKQLVKQERSYEEDELIKRLKTKRNILVGILSLMLLSITASIILYSNVIFHDSNNETKVISLDKDIGTDSSSSETLVFKTDTVKIHSNNVEKKKSLPIRGENVEKKVSSPKNKNSSSVPPASNNASNKLKDESRNTLSKSFLSVVKDEHKNDSITSLTKLQDNKVKIKLVKSSETEKFGIKFGDKWIVSPDYSYVYLDEDFKKDGQVAYVVANSGNDGSVYGFKQHLIVIEKDTGVIIKDTRK